MNQKNRIWKIFLGLASLFVLMFVIRVVDLSNAPADSYYENAGDLLNSTNNMVRRTNIASKKYKAKRSQGQAAVSVDQKYEKTANMTCKSAAFEKDENFVRQTIKEENALIQFEQKTGTHTNRRLFLQIGVPPDRFDAFIEKVNAAQKVVKYDVSKKDKTNEYRELNSKRETLKNTRASLMNLKSKGGKIEEYISLENRILDIDNQLQQLGVQLGNFDSENEFCTVNISLHEKTQVQKNWSRIAFNALRWTIEYYLMLVVAFAFALFCALVLVWIIDKLKVFQK